MIVPIRAKITAYDGPANGPERDYTFTLTIEEGGGTFSISGVKPSNRPFWGNTIQVDPSKLVGQIVPAQISKPENLIEAWFVIPPRVENCDTGQPGSGGMTMEEMRREGIPTVSPSDVGNTTPESGGIG